jgi:pimeloyl-ACP methyl ester carboxylesterase
MPAMSRRSPARPWPLIAAAVVTVAACSPAAGVTTERADPATDPTVSETTDPADTATTPETGAPETDPPATTEPSGELQWSELVDGVESTLLEVPVDYEDPDGPTFELFVARRLANDQENKIGSLLVNPGGPGFGGSDFAIFADQIYEEELLDRFDIVGWDPRGTGESEPAIDCIDDYDEYFAGTDITPDDQVEHDEVVETVRAFANRCAEENADIIEHVGTNNSVRDMDAIRRALGEEKISYFGFSYGSELGATWATLFPETVRAAVLDGAADPNSDPVERNRQQLSGFEETLTTYLAQCSADSSCAFHNDGDAEGAFDELMGELDENPIPSEPGRPDIARGEALQGVVQAMYSDSFWDQLSDALSDAQDGDGSGLLALYDAYFQRKSDGTWGNELEAFQSISCMDRVQRPTVEEWDAFAPLFNEAAPRIAPGVTGEPYFCVFFPPTIEPRAEITGAGAGPILVVGTTGDAATPLSSTRAMAETLEDGRLVVVTADQHTGYSANECVQDIVHRYLVDLEVPGDEAEC